MKFQLKNWIDDIFETNLAGVLYWNMYEFISNDLFGTHSCYNRSSLFADVGSEADFYSNSFFAFRYFL